MTGACPESTGLPLFCSSHNTSRHWLIGTLPSRQRPHRWNSQINCKQRQSDSQNEKEWWNILINNFALHTASPAPFFYKRVNICRRVPFGWILEPCVASCFAIRTWKCFLWSERNARASTQAKVSISFEHCYGRTFCVRRSVNHYFLSLAFGFVPLFVCVLFR